ncbi:MAG: sigma-70 family RNA polymerase sigma factor [Treponema sp.]|nr:sigma-70 family RNA polymerase sigma factor [Treponema sp.]
MLDCKKIYEDYSDKVYAYLRGHLHNQADIEDVHSQVFSRIVQYAPTYRGNPNAVSSFVYTITRNCTINYVKKKKPLTGVEAMDGLEQLPEKSNIEEKLIQTETQKALARAIAFLTEQERTLIIYSYYQNLSLKKTAIKMGISYGICKYLHKAALNKLKTAMKNAI